MAQKRCLAAHLERAYKNTDALVENREIEQYLLLISITVGIYTFTTNSMLIYGLHKTSQQQRLTKRLFVYLSYVDMMTLLIGAININALFYIQNVSCLTTFLLNSLAKTFYRLGFQLFLTISLLRFLSIKKPLLQVRNGTLNKVLLAETLIAVCYGSVFFVLHNYTVDSIIIIEFTVYSFLSISSIFTINLMSYYELNRKLRRQKRKKDTLSGEQTAENATTTTIRVKKKKQAVVTLIVITVAHLLSHLPFMIFSILGTVQSVSDNSNSLQTGINPFYVICFLYYATITNTGTNALIYILRNKEIKSFYKSVLLRRRIDW